MRWRKIIFSGSDVRQQKFRRKTTTTTPHLWLVFAVLLLFCAAGMGTVTADTVEVDHFQGLCEAIYQATGDNSTRTIVITDDIRVAETAFPAIGIGKSITLTPANDRDYHIYKTEAITSTTTGLFTISGGSLTITDNGTSTLTLDGNKSVVTSNIQPLVYADSGTFTLDGGVLTNNYADNGGGVYLQNNSSFTLVGGEIANNDADYYGGGVYVNNSTFTMSGGSIADNSVMRDGGGVYVDDGIFTMSGGTITSNGGDTGGVHLQNNSMFTLSGGTITNNSNRGVYLRDNSMLMMSGGEIANNIAEGNGGGVCVDDGSTFTLVDGKITNNTAENNGGGVSVYSSRLTMSGGTITGNNANYGGGVFVDNIDNSLFEISDSALIDATNEVYLSPDTFIIVTSLLTGGVQNITMNLQDRFTGREVIQLPQGTADLYQSNFTLSSQMLPYALRYNDTSRIPIYELAVGHNVTVQIEGNGIANASSTFAAEGSMITLTAVPNTDWSFSGWQVVNGSVSITGSKFTMPEENVTVRAVFTANAVPTLESGDGNMKYAFRVLFETNGGSTVAPITFLSYGDSITAPASPTKDGYTFGGWYKEEACVNAWMFASDTIPGDITLYAKWNGGATPTPTATSTVSPTIDPTVSPTATVSSAVSPTADTTGNQNQPGDASDGWGLMEISLFIILILIVIFLLLFFFLWRRRDHSRRNNEER